MAASFGNVAIIGTGLIGASLGLAMRTVPSPPRIVGFDISGENRRIASRLKAVDEFAQDFGSVVQGADLVIIATPVRSIELVMRAIAPRCAPGTLVSDTGSTKKVVLEWAEAILPSGVSFIGGHPMAGRITGGVDEPNGQLFQGAVYCIVPGSSADSALVEQFVTLVEALGAVPYFVAAEEHDGLVAAVSHLPFLLSSTLMSSVAGDRGWREMSSLAAGGFSTGTQLAEANSEMFADICLTNRDPIVRHIDRYIEHLQALRRLIESSDEGLRSEFEKARTARFEWLHSREAPPSSIPMDELRPMSVFSPGKLGELFRGRRNDRSERR